MREPQPGVLVLVGQGPMFGPAATIGAMGHLDMLRCSIQKSIEARPSRQPSSGPSESLDLQCLVQLPSGTSPIVSRIVPLQEIRIHALEVFDHRPIRRPFKLQPRLVSCNPPSRRDGPVLCLSNGQVFNGRLAVGSYNLIEGVGGKHNPAIDVRGMNLRQSAGRISVEKGEGGWLWEFIDRDTFRVPILPQQLTLGDRCGGLR